MACSPESESLLMSRSFRDLTLYSAELAKPAAQQ